MTAGGHRFLPYGRQDLDDDDIAAVVSVLRGDWLTTGPKVEAFEAALCQAVGARHAVACGSGTAGLHLAALALGLGPGDHVVVPTITFLATANAFRHVGAEIVFADVDPATGLMTPELARAAVARAGDRRLKAIATVQFAGNVADPAGLADIARERGLAIVEDGAHAIGSSYRLAGGKIARVGACEHAAMTVFSFHPVKTITTGEGGAVTTNDPDLHRSLVRFRSHGMVREPDLFENASLAFDSAGRPNPWYYEMSEPGFNYRMTDFQCALGLAQLAKLKQFVHRRAELMARYRNALAERIPIARLVDAAPGAEPAWHLCVVLLDFPSFGVDRAAVMHRLKAKGIGSQVHYIPVHQQPYYRRRYGEMALPGADSYYARCLSLPLFPGMTDEDVDRVVTAFAEALGQ